MSTAVTPARALRIGDVARSAGTTARTIRYYEEIGLLPQPASRPLGTHRLYTPAEIEHLREVIRLRDLLGVSLDELRTLVAAEEARAALREEYAAGVADPARLRELLNEARGHVALQLSLVRRRQDELARLEVELDARAAHIDELARAAAAPNPG